MSLSLGGRSTPAPPTSTVPAQQRGPGAAAPVLATAGVPSWGGSGPRVGASPACIVMVDDEPAVLDMLGIHLRDGGYCRLVPVADPRRVIDLLRASPPDLLLTDVKMPQVTGFDLLSRVRADPYLAHLPVIVLTAASDVATRLQALELGASDFLAKPVDPSELILRVRNNLAVKAYQDELASARRKSDRLLTSILPEAVADRLKRGEVVADHCEQATVLFADLVDFTDFASRAGAATVLRQLNEVFSTFDQLVDARGLEKIKTIGDAYMLAGGVPTPRADHARAVVDAGLAMLRACARLRAEGRAGFQLRVGVHTGPVVAGVIGSAKLAYDLWGDTVNVASRMESHGVVGRLQISDATRRALGGEFALEERGEVNIKGKGGMSTWLVRDGAR